MPFLTFILGYKDPDTGVWKIIMHTWDGKEIDITDTNDIFYTLSNCACDDWEIVEDWDKNTTQPDYMNDNCVTEEENK